MGTIVAFGGKGGGNPTKCFFMYGWKYVIHHDRQATKRGGGAQTNKTPSVATFLHDKTVHYMSKCHWIKVLEIITANGKNSQLHNVIHKDLSKKITWMSILAQKACIFLRLVISKY